jgi:hypothetical protein
MMETLNSHVLSHCSTERIMAHVLSYRCARPWKEVMTALERSNDNATQLAVSWERIQCISVRKGRRRPAGTIAFELWRCAPVQQAKHKETAHPGEHHAHWTMANQ